MFGILTEIKFEDIITMTNSHKVFIAEVQEITNLENSDFLSYVTVHGWGVVSGKVNGEHRYKKGDLVAYIPVDSMLDEKFINYFFSDSKVKPDSPIKHRVRSIRLRGSLSQGIILDINDPQVISLYPKLAGKKSGDDVTAILGVTKFEPPDFSVPRGMKVAATKKRHKDLAYYSDLENYKHYASTEANKENAIFTTDDDVVFTIKVHGSNMSVAKLEKANKTILDKVMELFDKKSYEHCVSSRRVQVNRSKDYKGFYGEDIYTKTAIKHRLLEKLEPGMQLFGEVFGDGVQGKYVYGCKYGEKRFLAFDLMVNGKYVDYDVFAAFCDAKGIERVPEVYRGKFSHDELHKHTNDHSHPLDKGNPCREGVVVKPVKEANSPKIGRKILKSISEKYYLQKDNTDFH